MLDESDAKQILTASTLENWRRPPGRPHSKWLKTTQQDLESLNLSLNEAIDVAQNHPLWRMMSTFGAMHSYWCMPEMNEWMTCSHETHLCCLCGCHHRHRVPSSGHRVAPPWPRRTACLSPEVGRNRSSVVVELVHPAHVATTRTTSPVPAKWMTGC